MKLTTALERERLALLMLLDSGDSACPDCSTAGIRVGRTPYNRWHIAVQHAPSCLVKRRASARRGYERWMADQLAVEGLTAHYCSISNMDLTHC